MNRSAREHLSKAKDFLAKGEGFYHKAAKEIIAAQEADTTLGYVEIGKTFDRSGKWARDLVLWHTSESTSPTPYSGDAPGSRASRGEAHGSDRAAAKKILREAPLEEVERIIEKLPPARRQAIAAAAEPTPYRTARRDFTEQEASLTPAQRSAREAAAEQAVQPARAMVAAFAELGIVGHLEQATEELRELVEDGSVNKRLLRQIEKAHDAWCTELDVARMHVGLEVQ